MFNYRKFEEDQVEFVTVASIDELVNGERMIFEIGDLPVALFNLGGQYYAIADLCSHDDGPVAEGELEGLEIVCPRHGARFNLETGEALTLPAVVDIPTYPVRVVGNEIQIGIPITED
ncbi:MAG: non-heme iron oxygenase ferredoxin subunit [Anaerolineaceae bacterium]|nr:MAG: non-heme iron oxygenase ferredoxin subunit [Anaerolineaceae bacterium]